MKNRDLTFIIKVQNAASSALKALRGDFNSAGKDASDAGKRVSDAGKAFDDLAKRAKMGSEAVKAAAKTNVDSANQEVSAQQRVAKAYDEVTVAKLRARNSRGQFIKDDAFVVGGTTGSRSLAAAATQQMRNMAFSDTGEDSAALAAMRKEAAELEKSLFPAQAAFDALTARQARLDEMLKAGVIQKGTHAAAVNRVKQEMAELEKATVSHTSSVKVNSLAIRETLVILREWSRGNFTRMPGSITILAQSFGLLDKAVAFLAGSAGILVGIFAALAVAFGIYTAASVSASQESMHLTNMLRLQAATSGLNVDSFKQMADSIAQSSHVSIASARSVAQELATSGALTGDQVKTLSNDAEILSKATGESADKIAKDFAKMGEGAGKYAEEFSKQYNGVLSPMQVAIIKDMDERGLKEQALQTLITDINAGIVQNTQTSTNSIVNMWHNAMQSVSDFWSHFKQQFSNDLADRIAVLDRRIEDVKDHPSHFALDPGYLDGLQKERNELQLQLTMREGMARWTAEQAQKQKDFTDATAEWQKLVKDDPIKFRDQAKQLNDWTKQAQAALKVYDTTHQLGGILKDADSTMIERIRMLVSKHDEILQELRKKDLPGAYKTDAALARKSARSIIEEMGGTVTSEVRTDEHQRELFLKAMREGHPHDAARPISMGGKGSAHERGQAIDWTGGEPWQVVVQKLKTAGYTGVFGKQEHNGSYHVQWTGANATQNKLDARSREKDAAADLKDADDLSKSVAKQLETLRESVEQAKKLPYEAKKYAELQKVINTYAEHGIDLNDKAHANDLAGYKKSIDQLMDEKNVNEAITALKEQNNKSEMKAYVNAQAKVGLTKEDQAAEDAKNAEILKYMEKFDTKEQALAHLGDKELQTQIAAAEAWARKNFQIDKAKIAVQQYNALLDTEAKGRADRGIMGLTGYDQQRAKLVQDRTFSEGEARGLDARTYDDPKFKEKWDEARKAAEGYGVELDRNREKQLQLEGNLSYGMADGLKKWADEARNMSGALSQLIGSSLNQLTDAVVSFAMTGKASFGQFIHSAIQGVEQLIVKMLLLKAIQFGLNMVSPGLGDRLTAGMHHTGGQGNNHAWSGSAMAFVGAPRFHNGSGPTVADGYKRMLGLKSNEYPAILLGDERVLNPAETRAYNASRSMAVGTQVTQSHLTYAPTNNFNFPSGGNQGGGKMNEMQQQKAAAALDDHMKTQLHVWIRDEMRPGGMLYGARPQH